MIEKQAIGFDKLDERQKEDAERIVDKYAPKIERMINNDYKLVLELKEIIKKGIPQEYTILLKVEPPAKPFTTIVSDWDLNKALHEAFQNIIRQIEHRYKD